MKTTPILLAASILAALVSFVPTVSAECAGKVAVGCEGGYYTWCSPDDPSEPGGGYRSEDGTCAPGFQPQPAYEPGCTLWMDSRGCVVG